VTIDHTQARLQRMEERLASLDRTVAVLAKVDDAPVKRIAETFADDPSMVIVYRGVQENFSQARIAEALRDRALPRADQARVSRACGSLYDLGFLKKRKPSGYTIEEGWQAFGIEKSLKLILRRAGIADLE